MKRILLILLLMAVSASVFAHPPVPPSPWKKKVTADTTYILGANGDTLAILSYNQSTDSAFWRGGIGRALRIDLAALGISGDLIKDFAGSNLSVDGSGVLNASTGGGLVYFAEADDNDTSVFTAVAPNTTYGINDALTLMGNPITGVTSISASSTISAGSFSATGAIGFNNAGGSATQGLFGFEGGSAIGTSLLYDSLNNDWTFLHLLEVPGFRMGSAYTFPTGDGTAGYHLETDGGGTVTWGAPPAGGGDVVSVGTPVNDQVGIWTGDPTLEGDADLTFDGSHLTTTGDVNALTFLPTGDVSAGDNSALGYTSADGAILAGQGSVNDITIKNDADVAVITIPTGTESVNIDATLSAATTHSLSIVPSATLAESEVFHAIHIDANTTDPTGTGAEIVGIEIDLSGVSTTNNPVMHGIEINVPVRKDALHVHEGQSVFNNTPDGAATTEFHALDVRVDLAAMASTSAWSGLSITAVGATSGMVAGMLVRNGIGPIRHETGTFTTPSQTEFSARKTGGGVTWVDGIDGIEILIANSDELYVGSIAQFSQIEVILSIGATKDCVPTFWYNTAADTWTQFFPDDETSGFQTSSLISWVPSSISGLWTSDGDPGGADGSTGYWIKIIRTRVADPGTPTVTTMKLGTVVEFDWDADGNITSLTYDAQTSIAIGAALIEEAELEILDGATLTTTELNYVDGVTSAIQTQLDAKEGTLTNSAGLLAALDDETGAGLAVFSTSPTFTTGITVPDNSISDDELDEGGTFTWTGVQDAGGATSLEVPNGTNPTTDAEGEIADDTDDDALEVYDGTRSVLIPYTFTKEMTIWSPDLVTDTIPIWEIDSAQIQNGIVITNLSLLTSVDGTYALKFFSYTSADPPILHDYVDTLNVGASDQFVSSVLFEDVNASTLDVGQRLYILTPSTNIDWIKIKVRYYIKDND